MTRVHLFTFREPLGIISKAKMRFMHEGIELWTSFTSPRRLNTDFPSCLGDELEDFPPVLILVKTEGLECLAPFSV